MRSISTVPVPQNRPAALDQRHPWLHALELFAVPFFSYAADGSRIEISTAAQRLIDEASEGARIRQQADQVAADALARSTSALPFSKIALVRELPSCSGPFTFSLYVARPALSGASAVVVARPRANESEREGPTLSTLTARERDVARLIASGLATKSVASRLGISSHTARHHIERVYAKLGVHSRAGIASLVGSRHPDATSHGFTAASQPSR